MNIKPLAYQGFSAVLLIVLATTLAPAHPWSCTETASYRFWHGVTQAVHFSNKARIFALDGAALFQSTNHSKSSIRWPD
ncbi:hypothetical protein N0A02_00440 [Paraburkholderia acidicola]|uniref:Uncharacterized protein n=1 Tax=Paraburkholderia acidicola TaxID=1912599 RepID=A0ABV1LEY3_9BURK